MGYSTTLYAVDLKALRSAVGSGDARLRRRVLPADKEDEKNPKRGPRVMLNRKGEILLNRRIVSFRELTAGLRRPEWEGTYLYVYEVRGARRGRWKRPGSFFSAVVGAVPRTQFLLSTICHSVENLFSELHDDWMSVEQAAAELVEGRVTRPGMGYQYGYGLERLCDALGTRLTSIAVKRWGVIGDLGLDTPLSKERSPVTLPKPRDEFPGIGYLTAAEVRREVDRLGGTDLSCPEDEPIEAGRKALLRSLRRAARRGVGVVAFYY